MTPAHAASCPPPPQCPPPVDTSCAIGGGETTFTTSTVTCYGDAPSQTFATDETDGGQAGVSICIGPDKSEGFFVCPGTVNFDTNVETVLEVGKVFADGFEQGPAT